MAGRNSFGYNSKMLRAFSIICLILIHTQIHAGPAVREKGVWEKLESGELNPGKGVVTDVDLSGLDIVVTVESKDESGKVTLLTHKLCRESSSTQWPDLVQASMISARRTELEEKKKSAQIVKFGQSGPFNPCFTFIK